MKLIQRANRQILVSDERAEDYLKVGYIEIDPKTGKPVGEKKAEKPAKKGK